MSDHFENPRFIEEWTVGETVTTDPYTFTPEKIIEFASEYDRQPMHTDPEYAANGPFGVVIASGFQTVAIAFRLLCDTGVFGGHGLGGPGMDEIRWLVPVRAGDTLTAKATVMEARLSKSKPDRGLLRLSFDVTNQHSETVLTFQSMSIIKARGG